MDSLRIRDHLIVQWADGKHFRARCGLRQVVDCRAYNRLDWASIKSLDDFTFCEVFLISAHRYA